MLFTDLKYSPNTIILRLASLRFFYIHVLKRGWSIAETRYPKKLRHLPGVLSQEEVARLIDAADTPFHRILGSGEILWLMNRKRASWTRFGFIAPYQGTASIS